jgi:hypothetical protein
MLVGGGILMLAPMYLNPTAGINGLTLIGIVVAITGATKLVTDGRNNV